jgi:cytochrome c oxidase subunit 1
MEGPLTMNSTPFYVPLFDWRKWLFTRDHKRIAILYAVSITGLFFFGAIAALLVRVALLSPDAKIIGPEYYNRLFTLHGVIMVWFFLIPSIPATLGNFLLPLMIGAEDVAFPRLNLTSFYLFLAGALITLTAIFLGGVDTGWTFYTPYSTFFSNGYVVMTVIGVIVAGFSSILTGLNFMVTVHQKRIKGLDWMKLPLFVWSLYSTSIILVLATPVLTVTLFAIILEQVFKVGIFDPSLGGDPVLFQHFFWFYSHPAVYVMVLPGMGVVSELITCFAKKTIFGYRFIAYSTLAIALLGFLLWGHHMFVSGQSAYSSMIFSVLSFLIGIPSAIKVFNWIATLYKGSITLETPMLYALGFIGLFTIGGLAGFFLASLALDVHLHDTYFVVAHFHMIMVGGMVMAYLGGIHFWWPKITGRLYSKFLSKIAVISLFIGFNITFLPQFFLGYLGIPRRYPTYPHDVHFLHVISTLGIPFLALGYILPLYYFAKSLKNGEISPDNPWNAQGMEWQTSSPPPEKNFSSPPLVPLRAYDYPGAES